MPLHATSALRVTQTAIERAEASMALKLREEQNARVSKNLDRTLTQENWESEAVAWAYTPPMVRRRAPCLSMEVLSMDVMVTISELRDLGYVVETGVLQSGKGQGRDDLGDYSLFIIYAEPDLIK